MRRGDRTAAAREIEEGDRMSDHGNGEQSAVCSIETLERIVDKKALDGDLRAIEVSRRIKHGRPQMVTLDLPPIDDIEGIDSAQAAVIAATAAGRIAPKEARIFSRLLENRRRTLISRDHEARLAAIEKANRERENEESP